MVQSAPRFVQFCQGLCTALQVECPDLGSGETPGASITITVDGVEFGLMASSSGDEEISILLVELGPFAAGKELSQCRVLLQSNFLLMGRDAPVFTLHPTQGSVFVHQVVCLDASLSPAAVLEQLRGFAQLVRRWREGEFSASDDSVPTDAGRSESMAAFGFA